MRKATVIALAASVLALAGCGGDKEVDTAQIRSVVMQFAEADGPEACKLLSPQGLVDVYGKFKQPVPVARRKCLRRSAKFEGEPIRIQEIEIVDDANVRVGAEKTDGTVSYNVKMVRYGPSWRIEKISQSRVTE